MGGLLKGGRNGGVIWFLVTEIANFVSFKLISKVFIFIRVFDGLIMREPQAYAHCTWKIHWGLNL